MAPKRSLLFLGLPFLVFLSFAALVLLHSSSSSSSSSRFPSHDPNSNTIPFAFTIKLLTYDRIDSLRRCLRSLAAASYGGDPVRLHIFVDHFRNGSSGPEIDGKLEEARRILDLVDGFRWPHGEKLVHYRTTNAGLQSQWLEAWWPASDDDFAFVVEDDLELSPLYYGFLKGIILKYYYDPSNYDPSIYGASLQRPRFVAGKHGNKLRLDSDARIFLYQMVGTWGQLLFPKPWKEFRLWYDVHKAKDIKPILQGMVTTRWYKKFGERIWTPWFIKFIHTRGYYNIYTNFKHEKALSISHRDAGVNYGKTAGPDSVLLDEMPLDFSIRELPPTRNLKWFDFCFKQILPGRIMRSHNDLVSTLHTLQQQKNIILVSLYKMPQEIAKNLICNLEKLSLQNVIFVGEDIKFIGDLARRGYPVIDASSFMYSIRNEGLLDSSLPEIPQVKDIWIKAIIVKKCLELEYSLWLIDGNIIPVSASLFDLPDPAYDFVAADGAEVMFVRSSQSSLRTWTNYYLHKAAAVVKSLIDGSSLSTEGNSFVHISVKALESQGNAQLRTLNASSFGAKLGAAPVNVTNTRSQVKMVFWPRGMALESIQQELDSLGLWSIDSDSSCTAVVC